jgi:Fe-S-cluster containining protein
MGVRYQDSLEKIKNYLQLCQTNEITISPLFYRDYSCPPNCGGCCPKFSLVYFEGERWDKFKELYPEYSAKFEKRVLENGVVLYEDHQKENTNHHCVNLNMTNGRCMIHESNPFSCEFELMKVRNVQGKISIINKLFGRGWQLKRIDGERGAMCEMKDFNYDKFLRDLKLLKELKEYAIKLNYDTILDEVISYLESIDIYLKNGMIPNIQTIIYKKNKIQNEES